MNNNPLKNNGLLFGASAAFRAVFAMTLVCCIPATGWATEDSALNDEPVPLQIESVPDRVRPLIEIGDTFLGPGNIGAGFTLPTGAVWQPNLLVWGNVRSGINYIDDEVFTGDDHYSEWANRIDLFAQLSLSQTERLVLAIRSFDEDGRFAGYRFHPDSGSLDGLTADISAAFFEFNLAEIFPKTKGNKRRGLDLDISIGRQPLMFQQSTLMVDSLDAIAVSRNNISLLPGASNSRATFLYAWNDVNRGNNVKDPDATLLGFLTETDFALSTVNFDMVWVESDVTGDGFYTGLSATQRLGRFNTAFRVVHSEPTSGSTFETTRGTLFVSEVSWTPHYTHNNVYANFFWAEDEFKSAARDFNTGGPLGLVGILYAAVGLGAYPAPLGNDARESYGGAVGYQMFFKNNRRQLIIEVGGRTDTDHSERGQLAVGARFQQAIKQHFVFRLDSYLSKRENFDAGWGARAEILIKF